MKAGDFVRAVHPELGAQIGHVVQIVHVHGSVPLPGSLWTDGAGGDLRYCFGYRPPPTHDHSFARVRWRDQSYPPVLPPTVITTHLRVLSPLEALAEQAT